MKASSAEAAAPSSQSLRLAEDPCLAVGGAGSAHSAAPAAAAS